MRVRSAYISSFATTAIIVGAALLMLALFGALVAFKRWPPSDGGATVDPIGLVPSQGPLRIAPAAFTIFPHLPSAPARPAPARPAAAHQGTVVAASPAELAVAAPASGGVVTTTPTHNGAQSQGAAPPPQQLIPPTVQHPPHPGKGGPVDQAAQDAQQAVAPLLPPGPGATLSSLGAAAESAAGSGPPLLKVISQ